VLFAELAQSAMFATTFSIIALFSPQKFRKYSCISWISSAARDGSNAQFTLLAGISAAVRQRVSG
jgi:hypothetical protein